jgi:hypothetical protein
MLQTSLVFILCDQKKKKSDVKHNSLFFGAVYQQNDCIKRAEVLRMSNAQWKHSADERTYRLLISVLSVSDFDISLEGS